jgi:hypothetical protein
MILKSLMWRMVVVVATALACSLGSAQSPGPAPNARQIRPQLPEGVKPRAGHGERLLLQPATGASQIVQLHCALGPYALVMLPTGELKVIEMELARPTTEPFVAATPEQMVDSLKSAGLSEFKVAHGTYYLYAYDCSEAFYLHARSILESMLPGVIGSLKTWGLKVERPAVPMVVVIMPSRAAYDAYFPMPKEVIAYYNVMTNHVVMYEDQRMWDAAPEFAAKQASYVIAHEGVHQLLANVGIQSRLSNWSPWISEGLAEYYCPLKVNSNLVRKGNSELPARTLRWTKAGMVNDLRMYSLLNLNTASGSVLKNLVEADEIDSEGYALAWGLVHYLASEKTDAFRAYMADISKYEPLDPANRVLAGRPDSRFLKHFGGEFETLEQEIQRYLTSKTMQAEYVDPIVNQTHYVVKSVEKQGRSFAIQLVITTSPAAAKKWKEEQEAANKKAKFFTKICKTRAEAEWQVQKLQQQ